MQKNFHRLRYTENIIWKSVERIFLVLFIVLQKSKDCQAYLMLDCRKQLRVILHCISINNFKIAPSILNHNHIWSRFFQEREGFQGLVFFPPIFNLSFKFKGRRFDDNCLHVRLKFRTSSSSKNLIWRWREPSSNNRNKL